LRLSGVAKPPGPVASLPMHDSGGARQANERLWRLWSERLRRRGVPAPRRLRRGSDVHRIWTDSRLLVAQSCSLPLACGLLRSVRVVALPVCRAAGCSGATCRSFLIVRRDAPRQLCAYCGGRVAVNDVLSHSGYMALLFALRKARCSLPFFALARRSGSHAASVAMVAAGSADMAAVDCVTWARLQEDGDPCLRQVRVIGCTPAAPSLPFVTARGHPVSLDGVLRETLAETMRDPAAHDACRRLRLRSLRQPDAGLGLWLRRLRMAWREAVDPGIAQDGRELFGGFAAGMTDFSPAAGTAPLARAVGADRQVAPRAASRPGELQFN